MKYLALVQDTDQMMGMLVGCLHLGQLTFTDEDACSIEAACDKDVAIIADCFGIGADQISAFQEEMVKERIPMGGQLIAKDLTKIKAMCSRDAIVKSIFQTMFADIVQHCNISVTGEKERAKGRVGVLDIFGFERMQFNSLEQICINYTNEKLHQTFINEVRFPLRFRRFIIMIRTEYETSRNVGESQPLTWSLS
jgi:myosin heavy subunit